jgi:hypothetical protein
MSALTSSSGSRKALLSTTPPKDYDDLVAWSLYWKNIKDLYLIDYPVSNDIVMKVLISSPPIFRGITDHGKKLIMIYHPTQKYIYIQGGNEEKMTIHI